MVVNITFNPNGGEGEVTKETFEVGNKIKSPSFYKENFKFVSWNTKSDGTGEKVTKSAEIKKEFGEEMELFAQWKPVTLIKATKLALEMTDEDYIENNKIIKDIQYKTYKALNRCLTIQLSDFREKSYLQDKFYEQIYNYYKNTSDDICCKCKLTKDNKNEFKLKSKDIKVPEEKEVYGKTLQGYLYNIAKETMPEINSSIVASVSNTARNQYKTDVKKGLAKGECSATNFKRNVPIPISPKCVNIYTNDKGYGINISFFNIDAQKKYSKKKIHFNIIGTDGNKKSILKKILDGTYTLKESKLIESKKGGKRKWILSISFEFIKTTTNKKTNILGIDIGINNAVAMSVYNPETKEYVWMSKNEALVSGREIAKKRNQFQKERESISKNIKLSKGGHGRRRKCKKSYALGQKEKNFKDLFNHKVSKQVIDTAKKYDCGLIQMEDLTNIIDDDKKKDSVFGHWAYYDLQSKIEYKAEENGIAITKIKPQFTSKRCSECGYINHGLKAETKWVCPICGKEHNRDLNAARNIVLPDIEKIIEEQMKEKTS